MKKRMNQVSGRAAWGIGDQIFSSATNFGVNILIARSLGASAFGAFSIAFSTYLVFLNLSRAVNTEPLAIRFSGVEESSWKAGTRRASASTLAAGMVGALICLIVAALSNGDVSDSFLALAITLPGLLYLDMWRFAFFAQGKGHRAMHTDVLWAIFMVPAMVWALSTPEPTLFLTALAWGGSATLAAVVAAIVWGVLPAFRQIPEWLRNHRDLTPSFVGEMATVSGASQLSLIGIGLVSGLAAVGAYRAAYVLFGPLRVIYQGLTLFGVPEAVRVLRESPQRLRRTTRLAAGALALIALAYGIALLMMPDSWGEFVLGETWAPMKPLIMPFTIGVVGVGLSMPTYIGLRALEAAKEAFKTHLTIAGLGVLLTIGGAAVGGAAGAAWADRTFLFLGSGLWWHVYNRELEERETITAQIPEAVS